MDLPISRQERNSVFSPLYHSLNPTHIILPVVFHIFDYEEGYGPPFIVEDIEEVALFESYSIHSESINNTHTIRDCAMRALYSYVRPDGVYIHTLCRMALHAGDFAPQSLDIENIQDNHERLKAMLVRCDVRSKSLKFTYTRAYAKAVAIGAPLHKNSKDYSFSSIIS